MSDSEIEGKKKEIQSILKEVLYNSLAQSIIKIISTPNLVLKVFLTICVSSLGCYASFLVINSLMDYLNYGVFTTSRTIYETPTLFPKVEFCNVNWITTQFAWNLTKMGIEHGYGLSNEEKKKLGHDLDDILIECKYNNQDCSSSDFLWSFDEYLGNCYTFNSGFDSNGSHIELKKSTMTGPTFGLRLKVYVNIYEKLLDYEYTKGLGLLIRIGNSSYLTYYFDSGIFISPGFNTYLSVDREFKSILPKPYSSCEVDSNSPTFIQDMDLYNLISKSDYSYTQELCFLQCYQNNLIKKYNCTDFHYLSLFNLTYCTDEVMNLIWNSGDDSFGSDFINKNCISLCPLECNQTLYKTSISFYQILDKNISTKIRENSKLASDFINRTMNLETIKESFVSVNIFYDKISYTISRESPKMDLNSLLASIGGNLSLFLGVSFFSICELIDALIEIHFILKKR